MGSLVPSSGNGNAVAVADGFNPWAEAARGISDGAYLKFNGNKGDITFGSDDDDLPEKSLCLFDMQSMALGWICWDNSQVVEEVMVDVVTGKKPPLEHDLTDHGPYADDDDGWREAASISAVLYRHGEDGVDDETVGTKLLFKTSTGGQVRSLKKLAQAYGRVFMQHPGELPIVELSVESYMPKVKKHGRKYSLLMKIVGWVTEAEAEAMMAGDNGDDERDYEEPKKIEKAAPKRKPRDEDEEEAAPAPRRRAAAPVEEEDEAPAPRRRAAAPVEDEDEDAAPAPRGRSAGRKPAAAPAPAEEEDEAPAPRRRAAAPVEEEDEAPAPRRRAAAPVEDEDEAPAPRRRAAAPVEDEDEAPAPRRRAAAPVDDADEDETPAPRTGRGSPSNARLRKFD